MASFVVAAIGPLIPPDPAVKYVKRMYIVDAANDQAAINLVADWDSEPAGVDYLAIPFNPKKASGG